MTIWLCRIWQCRQHKSKDFHTTPHAGAAVSARIGMEKLSTDFMICWCRRTPSQSRPSTGILARTLWNAVVRRQTWQSERKIVYQDYENARTARTQEWLWDHDAQGLSQVSQWAYWANLLLPAPAKMGCSLHNSLIAILICSLVVKLGFHVWIKMGESAAANLYEFSLAWLSVIHGTVTWATWYF